MFSLSFCCKEINLISVIILNKNKLILSFYYFFFLNEQEFRFVLSFSQTPKIKKNENGNYLIKNVFISLF